MLTWVFCQSDSCSEANLCVAPTTEACKLNEAVKVLASRGSWNSETIADVFWCFDLQRTAREEGALAATAAEKVQATAAAVEKLEATRGHEEAAPFPDSWQSPGGKGTVNASGMPQPECAMTQQGATDGACAQTPKERNRQVPSSLFFQTRSV